MRMVTLNDIGHKSVGSNAPPLHWGSVPTYTTEEDDDGICGCNTSGMIGAPADLLPGVSTAGRNTT